MTNVQKGSKTARDRFGGAQHSLVEARPWKRLYSKALATESFPSRAIQEVIISISKNIRSLSLSKLPPISRLFDDYPSKFSNIVHLFWKVPPFDKNLRTHCGELAEWFSNIRFPSLKVLDICYNRASTRQPASSDLMYHLLNSIMMGSKDLWAISLTGSGGFRKTASNSTRDRQKPTLSLVLPSKIQFIYISYNALPKDISVNLEACQNIILLQTGRTFSPLLSFPCFCAHSTHR